MNRNFFLSSGFFVTAGSTLVACGGGLAASAPLLAPGRRPSISQPGIGGGGGGDGTQPTPNPTDPASGLKIIGSVTCHMGAPSNDYMSFDWDATTSIPNALRRYIGAAWKVDQALYDCVVSDVGALLSTAAAVATYLQANGKQLASATSDIITYSGVYLAGGATAIELLGAVVSVLAIGDWLALLTTIGATAYEVYHLMHCAVHQVSS